MIVEPLIVADTAVGSGAASGTVIKEQEIMPGTLNQHLRLETDPGGEPTTAMLLNLI